LERVYRRSPRGERPHLRVLLGEEAVDRVLPMRERMLERSAQRTGFAVAELGPARREIDRGAQAIAHALRFFDLAGELHLFRAPTFRAHLRPPRAIRRFLSRL